MSAIAFTIMRWLGLPGLIAVSLIIFYEGVPIGPLRHVPVVGPLVAGIVDGRVDRAVQRATRGLVDASRIARLEAERDAEKMLRQAADMRADRAANAADEFNRRLTDAAIQTENLADEIDELLAQPAADDCRIRPSDIGRLRNAR